MKKLLSVLLGITLSVANATDYHVDSNPPYQHIADVPWHQLQAGDRIFIHWRAQPYKEKWVINARGTAAAPIQIIGVSNAQGQQPIIDGNGATTPSHLNFWNDVRGLIKIGGSSTPDDDLPQHIVIENLTLRAARPPYQFTDESGQTHTYSNNAAAIYVEKGAHLTFKNNTIHDAGNGIFVGAYDGQTQDIQILGNHIYDNGIVGRYYEHNTYTSAIGMLYEGNRFGALRAGALGNNVKDRSAGLIVRYNWIENGNRQLDLVDAYDADAVAAHPDYHRTLVYGNVLVEGDNQGNSQILHYGGDSGTSSAYRKGELYFYNNTIISTRSGNTTLMRLSTNDETAQVFNNVYTGSAPGNRLALIDDTGVVNLQHNWLKNDWQISHDSAVQGSVNDLGNNHSGNLPGFVDHAGQDFRPMAGSVLIDAGMALPSGLLPSYALSQHYQPHQQTAPRSVNGNALDIGAFERIEGGVPLLRDSFEREQ